MIPMMRIGKVGMRMHQRRMPVTMCMLRSGIDRNLVVVPMMFIVAMLVRVLQRDVGMFMLVVFRQMQPDAQRHEQRSDRQWQCHRLAGRKRHHRPEERRHLEIGAGACRAEIPQADHEAHQADAVGEKADRHGGQCRRPRRQGIAEPEGE